MSSGIRGDFVGATRGAYHRGAYRPKRERDTPGGDVYGHVDHLLEANSEHGGGAGNVGEGDGECNDDDNYDDDDDDSCCFFRRGRETQLGAVVVSSVRIIGST